MIETRRGNGRDGKRGEPDCLPAHPPTGGGGIIETRGLERAGGRGSGGKVRGWVGLFFPFLMFSSSLLAYLCPCRLRLVSFSSCRRASCPASRPCVSCLLVVLRGRAFSFRRSPVVPVFAFVPFHRFRRLVLRLVCACRETGRCVDGACDGTRGVVVSRVMIWMGRGRSPFSSCLLVLRCPPGYDRRDRPALPVCLLAVLSFRYGDGYEARHGWETAVRMTRA